MPVLCVVNYLKKQNALSSKITFDVYDGDQEECDGLLARNHKVFYKKLLQTFQSLEQSKETLDCFINNMKATNFHQIHLERQVYRTIDNLPKRKQRKEVIKMNNMFEKQAANVMKLCLTETVYGALFDKLMTKSLEPNDEIILKEEFCMRQYVVDNKLIDATLSNVNLNPENVNVTEVDCKTIIDSEIDDEEVEWIDNFHPDDYKVPNARKRCIVQKFRNLKYFNTIAKIFVMSELTLTDEQRSDERNAFITINEQMIRAASTCKYFFF